MQRFAGELVKALDAELAQGRGSPVAEHWQLLVPPGDWSYSLYLMHPFALLVVSKTWQWLKLHELLPWPLLWVLDAGELAAAGRMQLPPHRAAAAAPPASVYALHAVGGAEKVAQSLAEGAAALGHQVAVAHLAPRPAPAALRNGVEVRPLAHRNPLWIEDASRFPAPVRNFNKVATLFNVLTAADFERALREVRPDVVHSHSMVELTPAMWAAARRRSTRCMTWTCCAYAPRCSSTAGPAGGSTWPAGCSRG